MRCFPRILWGVCLLAGASGCTHAQLGRSTTKQAGSITELQYRQVLDNVALFHGQPDSLPHFAVVGTGGTTVTDHGEASAELEWDPYTIVREQLGLLGWREIGEEWTMAPVVNPDKLRAIRCAFQLATTGASSDKDADALLKAFLGDHYQEWIRQDWYGVGCRLDVPKDACYVGRCGRRFVWVMPDQLDSLTRLTIAILNIATLDPAPAPEAPTKTVYSYSYTADGKVHSVTVEAVPKQTTAPPSVTQPRKDFYNPLQSQLQRRGR